METPLAKYTQQSFFTHPGQFLNTGHPIPDDIAAMVRLVQHNLIHAYWLENMASPSHSASGLVRCN